jgi:MSHA biogenesis protein MshP
MRCARRAGGFTLISAVFLMLVLVVLGVALVTMSAVQHTTSAQQVQSARAAYAVRAGIEWAIERANTPGVGCPAGPTSFGLLGMLSSFTVSVSCTLTIHTVAGSPTKYYVVDVTAQSGAYGSPDFVMRRGQAKVLGT